MPLSHDLEVDACWLNSSDSFEVNVDVARGGEVGAGVVVLVVVVVVVVLVSGGVCELGVEFPILSEIKSIIWLSVGAGRTVFDVAVVD